MDTAAQQLRTYKNPWDGIYAVW